MRPVVWLCLVALLSSGCLSADTPTPASGVKAEAFAAVRELLADVPCEAAVGADTSQNMRDVELLPFDGSTHSELDIHGDLLLVARYQHGGFQVIDISDPAAKRVVGLFESDGTTAFDVKWFKQGDGAIVGLRDGVEVVDMTQPEVPVHRSKWSFADEGLPGSAHMVFVHEIGGTEWVFIAPNANTGVYILERVGWDLVYRASYEHPALGGGPIGPHDMTVLDDEELEKPVLYVANGFEGWLAADVSDPTKPLHLGGMINADPAQGYLHTIQAVHIDGKRLVATVSEVGVNAVKVWDATDLSLPVLLGSWYADPARPTLPNHNLQIVGELLYVAHYGEGVFVFDLKPLASSLPYLGTLDLKPVARFAPVDRDAASVDAVAFTNVWDVVVKDGLLYVSDVRAGVHTVGFGCLTPGDEAQTSLG